MILNQTTAPEDTLVTLAEAKAHLGIEYDDDDDRLTALLIAATDLVERDIGYCLVEQEWTQTQPTLYPVNTLDMTPVTAVEVTYRDEDGDVQTLDAEDYYVYGNEYRQYLAIKDTPPTTEQDRRDAVTITMTCGRGVIPPVAKHACLMLVASWNENREAEITGTISKTIELGYERLISSIRKGRVA